MSKWLRPVNVMAVAGGKVAENIMDRPVFLMEARPFFLMFKTYFGIVQ